MMAYCLACQDWTENINCQIQVCANQKVRESSNCTRCGARKSVFLREDAWKACILAHRANAARHTFSDRQQQQQQHDTNEHYQEQRQESRNIIPTPRQMFEAKDREFRTRLDISIRHQWNIDHVNGYYDEYKEVKQKASLRVSVF